MANKIKTYKTYLDDLDKIDPFSISKGIAFYKGLFTDCGDGKIKDEGFWLFRDFYYVVVVEARNFLIIKEFMNYPNDNKNTSDYYMEIGVEFFQDASVSDYIKSIIIENGLHMYQNNRRYYLYDEPDFLLKQFQAYVSEAMQEFLQQELIEKREGFQHDMALRISWKRLGERIISKEKFLKKYPDFIKRDLVKDWFCLEFSVLLIGLDNSRPFEYISYPNELDLRLDFDVRKVYERYIKNYNPEFASAVVLHKYYGILRQSSFIMNDQIQSFLDYVNPHNKDTKQRVMGLIEDAMNKKQLTVA